MLNSTNKGRQFPHWKDLSVHLSPTVRSIYVDGLYRLELYRRKEATDFWNWALVYKDSFWLSCGTAIKMPKAKYDAVQTLEGFKTGRVKINL